MALVAPINLPYNVRTLWFDPNGIEIQVGDKVVVQTARGMELGVAAAPITEVDESSIAKLKSPLKPVLRIASDQDLDKADEMERLSREAMPIFKELARETSEEMHPVSVEYLLDGDKAIFYFEAEERIDFRELVRKLAAHFHIRIDMHQIGVRDEARIIGGIAHCGQEVCCKRLGGEFKPVSIRMAKDQDLSLNPQKISGLCGRLMCCLRYENDAYNDFKSRSPKVGSKVKTPEGEAKVISLDVPKEIVTVQPEDAKPIKVQLSDFKKPKEGKKPDTITAEGWERANQEEELVFESSNIFSTSHFTGEDKLGSAKAIHHPTRSSSKKSESSKSISTAPKETHRKQRRRRSTVIQGRQAGTATSSSSATTHTANASKHSKPQKIQDVKKQDKEAKSNKTRAGAKLRPGHKSSGLSASGTSNTKGSTKKQGVKSSGNKQRSGKSAEANKQSHPKVKPTNDGKQGASSSGQRRRRRRHDINKPRSNDKGSE